LQYDNKTEAPTIDHKNIPMIKYLREKAEKKLAEKRLLRRSQEPSRSGGSSSGKGSKGSSTVKERGERGGGGKSVTPAVAISAVKVITLEINLYAREMAKLN
jgi:hypothetical protein